MVVEKQKLDNKVKELKDRVQVGGVAFICCLFVFFWLELRQPCLLQTLLKF